MLLCPVKNSNNCVSCRSLLSHLILMTFLAALKEFKVIRRRYGRTHMSIHEREHVLVFPENLNDASHFKKNSRTSNFCSFPHELQLTRFLNFVFNVLRERKNQDCCLSESAGFEVHWTVHYKYKNNFLSTAVGSFVFCWRLRKLQLAT